MISISVIIPTHNRKEILPGALESVFSQTRPPDEVIVVDDGSTDGTAELVRDHFPAARYFYQENQGVSAARNRGIASAHGPWLAFLDSDDQWLPEKLAKQIAAIEAHPQYRICHAGEIWIRHGRRVNPMKKHAKHGGWIFERCLALCLISPSTVMIERSLFDEVGLFDEALPACEDYDLWLRITPRHPVLYLDEPLVIKHGGHEDQLSRRYWGMDRFRIQALEKLMASKELSDENRRAALRMLIEKIGIYLEGARKRGKKNEVEAYQQKMENYQH